MEFTEFSLHKNILKGIENAGFKKTMPVQEKTIIEVLANKDVGVQSQTGSGKTAAFLIPILQYYAETEKENWQKTLIIAPTRELVVQIETEVKLLGFAIDIKSGSFFGGIGYGKQDSLINAGVDIIIGTPGRLIDFGKSGKINFHNFFYVVIDEADRLFDMGFYPEIKKMMEMMLPPKKRLTMLFSATLSTKVMNLAWMYMNNPVTIEIEAESVTVDEIKQSIFHISRVEKMSLLLGVLKKENPSSAIIFTNTKYAAVELAERLKVNDYDVSYIMGDLPQKKRLSVINKVKSGKVKFLVATDVAARGLHVNNLDMVVNYDIPEDYENYVHRIGRTARAGKKGRAVTFACEKFVYGLEAIEKYINMKIPVEWPTKEMFLKDKSVGMNFYREKQAAVTSSGRQPYDNRSLKYGITRVKSGVKRRPNREISTPQSSLERKKCENRGTKNQQKINSGKKNISKRLPTNPPKRNIPSKKPDQIRQSRNKNNTIKLTRNSSDKERLAYYRSKYGEDFKLDPSTRKETTNPNTKQHTKQNTFFRRLFKINSKKNKG